MGNDISTNSKGEQIVTHKVLEKKGIIVDSQIPLLVQKKTIFFFKEEDTKVKIVCKISGIAVEQLIIEKTTLVEEGNELLYEQITFNKELLLQFCDSIGYSTVVPSKHMKSARSVAPS